jgi:Replication-relaxation
MSLKKMILYALNLEKHLTARHLARLIDPQNDAWERVRKSLQRMENESLVKSKHYGLGKDKIWSLANQSVIKQLGYEPPKSEIHSLFYDHQIARGNVFVSLALTGKLLEWESEPKLKRFRPDALARISETNIYIEVERGNQNRAKIIRKIENYLNYYRETKEPFHVIFIVPDDLVNFITSILEQMKPPQMYQAVGSDSFIKDPLNADLFSWNTSHTLSEQVTEQETYN